VTTIESVEGAKRAPLQAACGSGSTVAPLFVVGCSNRQVIEATALLRADPEPNDEDIDNADLAAILPLATYVSYSARDQNGRQRAWRFKP